MPTPTLPIRSTITVSDSAQRVDELVRLHRAAADAVRSLTRALEAAANDVPHEHLAPMLMDDPDTPDISPGGLTVLAERADLLLAELGGCL